MGAARRVQVCTPFVVIFELYLWRPVIPLDLVQSTQDLRLGRKSTPPSKAMALNMHFGQHAHWIAASLLCSERLACTCHTDECLGSRSISPHQVCLEIKRIYANSRKKKKKKAKAKLVQLTKVLPSNVQHLHICGSASSASSSE